MRLGAYEAMLKSGTRIADIYGSTDIFERHRHRYEVNIDYKDRLEDCGLVFSGMSPDGVLPETIEYADHPWFIGVQYHPELKSRPFEPHPLFASFIQAAMDQTTPRTPRPVDHLVLPVVELDTARQRLEALGFTVAPSAQHPFGTENAC
eukprot:gene29511-36177_t